MCICLNILSGNNERKRRKCCNPKDMIVAYKKRVVIIVLRLLSGNYNCSLFAFKSGFTILHELNGEDLRGDDEK